MSHRMYKGQPKIRWRVKRHPLGWAPVVLIGEEPVIMPVEPDKATARRKARTRAANMRGAPINLGDDQ